MQKFIMLVGLPGSGKSTYAKELKKNLEDFFNNSVSYHSSDSIREELYGDENIQGSAQDVFSLMHKRTIEDIKNGVNSIIYDATNIKRKDRLGILNQVKALNATHKYNIDCECHIVWARFETCIERNNNRERVVPEEVIWRMAKQFQTPWHDEGWDEIKIIQRDSHYWYDDLPLDMLHDNSHHENDSIKEHIDRVRSIFDNQIQNKDKDEDYDFLTEGGHEAMFNLSFSDTLDLSLLAKVHDIGKVYTKDFHNSKGEVTEDAHYYQHQNVGAYMVLGLDHLCIENHLKIFISYLTLLHMEPFFDKQPSNYWKKEVDPEIKKLIYLFNECDRKGA